MSEPVCICTLMCLHTGWSVLIISKLLHNAVKHYSCRKLNIKDTRCTICRQQWGFRDDEFRGCVERHGERDDFQGNGKSIRGGNTREKQRKEKMHLPDRAAAVGK